MRQDCLPNPYKSKSDLKHMVKQVLSCQSIISRNKDNKSVPGLDQVNHLNLVT